MCHLQAATATLSQKCRVWPRQVRGDNDTSRHTCCCSPAEIIISCLLFLSPVFDLSCPPSNLSSLFFYYFLSLFHTSCVYFSFKFTITFSFLLSLSLSSFLYTYLIQIYHHLSFFTYFLFYFHPFIAFFLIQICHDLFFLIVLFSVILYLLTLSFPLSSFLSVQSAYFYPPFLSFHASFHLQESRVTIYFFPSFLFHRCLPFSPESSYPEVPQVIIMQSLFFCHFFSVF